MENIPMHEETLPNGCEVVAYDDLLAVLRDWAARHDISPDEMLDYLDEVTDELTNEAVADAVDGVDD
jgi:hypothetical protein